MLGSASRHDWITSASKRICVRSQRRTRYSRLPSRVQPSCVASTKRIRVYVAKTPLIGLEGPAALIGDLYPREILHSMVVLQEESDGDACLALDFIPLNATSPVTATRLITGQSVAGQLREKRLTRLPEKRCWFVGEAQDEDALSAALEFHHSWVGTPRSL
ncbi:hypothetical protein CYMTET_49344 [Cymbomonas tetramitiformis]|uniref:Uncharacterized protein n=1 Tax=Cymbomonas tetramitiformis TaxID=36881 RepID=A0AAE0ETZ8_9CHLO|nr:hypothetical protein CYMTET_49344 [Cymbomonas tetramitiformis]